MRRNADFIATHYTPHRPTKSIDISHRKLKALLSQGFGIAITFGISTASYYYANDGQSLLEEQSVFLGMFSSPEGVYPD